MGVCEECKRTLLVFFFLAAQRIVYSTVQNTDLEVPSSCSGPSSCTVKKKWICVETFFWYYSFFECDSVPPKPRAAHWKPESKPSHFALSQLQLGKARVHANSFARCKHIGLRFCRSKSKILRRVTKLWLAQNGKYSGL